MHELRAEPRRRTAERTEYDADISDARIVHPSCVDPCMYPPGGAKLLFSVYSQCHPPVSPKPSPTQPGTRPKP